MPNLTVAVRLIACMALVLVIVACGSEAATPTAVETPSASPTPSGTPEPVALADLAHAVVQIISFTDSGPYALGSGTVISADGLILTNAHVVTVDDGTLDHLEIGLTDKSDTPPAPTYIAEIAAMDQVLDLAILRVSARIDGAEPALSLPYVEIGDSDTLEIGDTLHILGYPAIGGETITLTSGLVSGFVGDASLGQRAWVKTDATIAGGNSGGLAADTQGRIVAVPTIASSGADDEIVDCRPIRDTNRDGRIDDDDDCVPIGGFLNGLRPIALAATMIDAVQTGVAYVPLVPPGGSGGSGDLDKVLWEYPTFGQDATADDQPVGEAIGFASGTTSICAFWEYEGMEPGMRWSAEWSVDGTLNENVSYLDETWSLDPAGTFWVCAQNADGLADGMYDVALVVEDQLMSGGFAFVGDGLVTTEVTFRNASSDPVCYLYASPAQATVWGPDRLDSTQIVGPGQETHFQLIGADYDFSADDCDGDEIFTDAVDLTGSAAAMVSWTGSDLAVEPGDPTSTAGFGLGDCFNGQPGVMASDTDLVACSGPHYAEIVGFVQVPSGDGAFPGDSVLTQMAEAPCTSAFAIYVGIDYQSSIWYMTVYHPTASSWGAGDRLTVCALVDADDGKITGSKRGVRE